jgi:hypothetical protein
MKNIICFCLSLIFVLKTSEGQVIGNTLNSCNYVRFYDVGTAIPITSIQISGDIESNLGQCCEKCRAFPNCVVWKYFNNVCYFYSSFDTLVATPNTTNSYVGKRFGIYSFLINDSINKFLKGLGLTFGHVMKDLENIILLLIGAFKQLLRLNLVVKIAVKIVFGLKEVLMDVNHTNIMIFRVIVTTQLKVLMVQSVSFFEILILSYF